MSSSLVSRLETDAKLVRTLLLVRASLWTSHGAVARMPAGEISQLNHRMEVDAIDAALKSLCVEPPPGLPAD
ncbi:MAG: hypothetical protein ABI919_00950 [Ramlibacter sp.]